MSGLARRVVVYMVALGAALVIWGQGLVICPSCGREDESGRAVACAHCGAVLPKARTGEEEKPVVVAEPVVAPGAAVSEVARRVVADSFRQAQELRVREAHVAYAYYYNALAVSRLVEQGGLPEGLGDQILKGIGEATQQMQQGRVQCRRCDGSGKFKLDLSKVPGHTGTRLMEGVACRVCKGSGWLPGLRDVAETRQLFAQGHARFVERQIAAGDVRLGRAMVPAELAEKLNNRQRALVMTGVPTPCRNCQLSGRQACTQCRGIGWVRCTARDCNNGVLRETTTGTGRVRVARRLNEEEVKRCPVCDGGGEVACEICRGERSVTCRICDGSGQAARCNRCAGTGLGTCTKCRGAGEVRGAVCVDCKGEGEALCSACRGEGATVR